MQGQDTCAAAGVKVWCSMGDEEGWWGRQGVGWTVFLNRKKQLSNTFSVHNRDQVKINSTETRSNEVESLNLNYEIVPTNSNNNTFPFNISNDFVNFTQPWKTYEEGFGSLENEFFIGNC